MVSTGIIGTLSASPEGPASLNAPPAPRIMGAVEPLPALSARIAVSCDFDDTVVQANLSLALFQRFGQGWEEDLARYRAGQIPVEEWNARALWTVRATRQEIERFAREQAHVRPGFAAFAGLCREAGVALVINSSGLDLYIRPVLQDLGLADLRLCCGHTELTDAGFRLRYQTPDGAPLAAGTKAAAIRWLKAQGARVIHIGDGRSDEPAADGADFVFARSSLLEYCRRQGLPHAPFEDFYDVMSRVRELGLFREGGEAA